jgi:hypothetical protein
MLSLAGLFAGCGHLAFTDLPLDESDASIEGGNDADRAPVRDAGGDVVVDVRDSAVIDVQDAGCTPPGCPGLYVSALTGSDDNPGSWDKPFKTIGKGLRRAQAIPGRETVFVAQGNYGEKVTLVEGVNLLGGYACTAQPCSWARAPLQNDTVIFNSDPEGVVAPSTMTRATLIEGIKVHAFDGNAGTPPGNVALTIDRGTPTIRACRLLGSDITNGSSDSRRSIGVAVYGPPSSSEGALLEGNTITSANATHSIGVLLTGARSGSGQGGPAVATLRGNVITSGRATGAAVAVMADLCGKATLLEDNDITGGVSTATEPSSWGVIANSSLKLEANRINVAAPDGTARCEYSATWCGGISVRGGATEIRNNVVFGARAPMSCAIYLANDFVSTAQVIINANTLDGAGMGTDGSPASSAIVLHGSQDANGFAGRIRNNILLGGNNKNRYGVYEEALTGRSVHAAALEYNDFWNVPPSNGRNDNAYRLWEGDAGHDIPFAALPITDAGQTNINADPKLGAGQHLQQGSPCIDNGTATEAPNRDFEDDSRPINGKFDIGADEAK